MKISYYNDSIETYCYICSLFCFVVLFLAIPDFAFATADGISTVLCTVVNKLTGTIGRAVSTIAVVVLGIGLFLGKLSWGLAIATSIGIGMIFGANTVVGWLSGTAQSSCATA